MHASDFHRWYEQWTNSFPQKHWRANVLGCLARITLFCSSFPAGISQYLHSPKGFNPSCNTSGMRASESIFCSMNSSSWRWRVLPGRNCQWRLSCGNAWKNAWEKTSASICCSDWHRIIFVVSILLDQNLKNVHALMIFWKNGGNTTNQPKWRMSIIVAVPTHLFRSVFLFIRSIRCKVKEMWGQRLAMFLFVYLSFCSAGSIHCPRQCARGSYWIGPRSTWETQRRKTWYTLDIPKDFLVSTCPTLQEAEWREYFKQNKQREFNLLKTWINYQNMKAVPQHPRIQWLRHPSANSNKLNTDQPYSCLRVMGRRELNHGSSQERVSSGGNQVGTNWSDSAGFPGFHVSSFSVTMWQCDDQTSMENSRHQVCWLRHDCSIIQSCQNRTLQILCHWIKDLALLYFSAGTIFITYMILDYIIFERCLQAKLPTIWTDGNAQPGRNSDVEKVRRAADKRWRKSQERRCRCVKR